MKIIILKLATILIITSFYANGQSLSIGARFTPNVISPVYVRNPSPSLIYGPKKNALEAALYVSKYFNSRLGLKASADFGLVPWELVINAPRNAFGMHTGEEQIFLGFSTNDFSYTAVTLGFLYQIPFRENLIELVAGPSFRHYSYGEEPEGVGLGLNRASPYDPNDPTHGPPDVYAHINALADKMHVSLPVAVNYSVITGQKTKIKFGLMHNIAFKPLADSELTVIMYGDTYKGKFSPRTSFWGLNMQFEYLLSKSKELPKPASAAANTNGKHRKSLFAELKGNGVGISGNFDMRFKPDRNDGLGFRAGFGSGYNYYSDDYIRRYATVPLSLNYIVGKKRSGLETGIGITPQFAFYSADTSPNFGIDGFFNLGYRLQPLNKGVMLRANWTPLLSSKGIYVKMFGVSTGYSFK